MSLSQIKSNQISVSTPVSAGDVVRKDYVDNLIQGLSWKNAVRAATTVNGTLATAYANGQVIDGVTLVTGDRILIKNQTTQTDNGIYVVTAGAPTRSLDAVTGTELVNATVFVSEGTVTADTSWTQTANATITIGSTNIVFAQMGTGSGTRVMENFASQTGSTVTVANTPNSQVMEVHRNGVLQILTSDYTVAAAVITFTTALATDNVTVIYSY